MSIENSNEKLVTFENTIKEGNQILIDGIEYKLEKVEHMLPNRGDGGFWKIMAQPIGSVDSGDSRIFQVNAEEVKDWYILYQNGKK